MFALMSSVAIRGALRSVTSTSALNPASAWWTFGWFPFAAHQAVMIGSGGGRVRAVDDERPAAVAPGSQSRSRPQVLDARRRDVDVRGRGLRLVDPPADGDAVLQQPVDEPVGLPHPEVLVERGVVRRRVGVHRDDQRARGESRRRRRRRAGAARHAEREGDRKRRRGNRAGGRAPKRPRPPAVATIHLACPAPCLVDKPRTPGLPLVASCQTRGRHAIAWSRRGWSWVSPARGRRR